MAVFLSVLAVLAVLALDWLLRYIFVMPLPECVDTVFDLTPETEAELEQAARGFRYLKNHRLLRGCFRIVLSEPSSEGLKLAQLLARSPDVVLMTRECPK